MLVRLHIPGPEASNHFQHVASRANKDHFRKSSWLQRIILGSVLKSEQSTMVTWTLFFGDFWLVISFGPLDFPPIFPSLWEVTFREDFKLSPFNESSLLLLNGYRFSLGAYQSTCHRNYIFFHALYLTGVHYNGLPGIVKKESLHIYQKMVGS